MSIMTISENTEIERPSHYILGNQIEATRDVILPVIDEAPCHRAAVLHAQILKYLIRVWRKNAAAKDLRKARWYLDRLIDLLDDNPHIVREDGHKR